MQRVHTLLRLQAIEGAQLASYIEVIANAKVPIVKMDHAATGIAVDICCNVTNGLNTGRIIREFIEEFPQLMPLTLVLKTFLVRRTQLSHIQVLLGCYAISSLPSPPSLPRNPLFFRCYVSPLL